MINLHGHEPFCDIRAGRSVKCNCVASIYIEEIESLREKLSVAVEAIRGTVNQRNNGYPTYSEWEEIWRTNNAALAKIKETEK